MPELEGFLPYGRQSIDDDDVAEVVAALRSVFLTTGPRVEAFEAALCSVTGARHAVALSSGTAALHTAYATTGIGPGNEVVTSPLTFAATANAAIYLGARPIFADIEPSTGTLAPEAARAAITDRTRAIVAVDYAGQPADYVALRRVADGAGVTLLADSAHSLGAADHGKRIGSIADATVLSFHPVKHITTGEGGALLTSDEAIASAARDFRSHGITREPERLQFAEGPWSMEMQTLGYNYRLTDLQSALGIAQLRKLPGFVARRREIAARYSVAFGQMPEVVIPRVRADSEHAWHLYVLRVAGEPGLRKPFFELLRARGLGVQVHYVPVYQHPYYRGLGYRVGTCPVAEDFYARAVSIPIFPRMTDDDVSRVIETVAGAVAETLS